MKTINLLGFIFTLLLLSCREDEGFDCNEADEARGAIIEMLDLNCPFNRDELFVIQDQSTFSSLFRDCLDEFPGIDFQNQTLVGLSTTASGCDRSYIREMKVDEERKQYEYIVKIKECGNCKPLVLQMHWALVPKLANNYSIDFKIEFL